MILALESMALNAMNNLGLLMVSATPGCELMAMDALSNSALWMI